MDSLRIADFEGPELERLVEMRNGTALIFSQTLERLSVVRLSS